MRRHRGPAPEDGLFRDPDRLRRLREAVSDLSWLLRRGYASRAASELVGNRYQLNARERLALSHASWDRRERSGELSPAELRGATVCVDGFNLLITLETALGGGVLIRGVDGRVRDLANVHGTYSLREETEKAVELALEELGKLGVAKSCWYFDRPVSNSGRLAALVRETGKRLGVPTDARAIDGVDRKLRECEGVVVTADSAILDGGVRWFDLAGRIVERRIPGAWIVDLGNAGGEALS
jgi:hypothetical protein